MLRTPLPTVLLRACASVARLSDAPGRLAIRAAVCDAATGTAAPAVAGGNAMPGKDAIGTAPPRRPAT